MKVGHIFTGITICWTCGFALSSGAAPDPDALFHQGSQAYTEEDTEGAKELVEQGLQQYPEDYKLMRLHELLQQQQNQQQQQDQQQQQQDKQNEQQQQDSQQQQQDQQQQNDREQQEQTEQEQPSESEETDEQQEAEPSPAEPLPEQMTEEEALMMLEALKQEEEADRMQYRVKQGSQVPVDKDW